MNLFKGGIFPYNPTNFSPESIPSLKGKVVIVTGGNTGVGYQTTLQLAKKGAKVYLAARSPTRASEAIEKMKKEDPNIDVVHLQLDLQDLNQVNEAASQFLKKESKLDILVNNAGIMACPFALSKDGIETQFATNHVGHFLFTRQLLPALFKVPEARVVNLSSVAHTHAPADGIKFDQINDPNAQNEWSRYGQSKLANILFTAGLNSRYGDKIIANSVHPGWVDTELIRGPNETSRILGAVIWGLSRFFALTPLQGAYTSLYAATSPDIVEKKMRNVYFVPLADQLEPTALARDEKLADKLWDFTNKLVDEKLKK
jgi:retinol dehydrogenase 12